MSKIKSDLNGAYFRFYKRNFQHIYYQHIEQLFLRAKENRLFRYDFNDYRGEEGISEIPYQSNENGLKVYYASNQRDFEKIPSNPIGYWAVPKSIEGFLEGTLLEKIALPKQGSTIGDNERFYV